MKTLNWGIIGCGSVTEVKSGPAFQQVSGFKLMAVMRRDYDKAKDFALRHSVPKFYDDADALIQDSKIDAIYIATPPDSHCYYALKVAHANKICCIEKPMATSYEESVQINNAFDEKNIPLFVSYYRRSLPRFNKVKSWLDQNEIGKIRHITWNLQKPANAIDISKTYNWRTDINIAYGGYFDDLASHGLDLFTYLLGDITKATGVSLNQQNLYTAMDSVAGSWIHDSGVTGSGSWNFAALKRIDRVQIFGVNGKIEFSIFDDVEICMETNDSKKRTFIENPKTIQLYHIQNIKDDLSGKIKHPSQGESASHTQWVMDKILNKI
jgi:predicted dehydrogenase